MRMYRIKAKLIEIGLKNKEYMEAVEELLNSVAEDRDLMIVELRELSSNLLKLEVRMLLLRPAMNDLLLYVFSISVSTSSP